MLPFINPMMLGGGKLRPQDVFATSLYTGNGGTQTITNGLDLAGKGGLLWRKARTQTFGHGLSDTLRGPQAELVSNSTDAEAVLGAGRLAFNSDGWTQNSSGINGLPYVGWAIRFAKKFAVAVTYTGNGVAGRQIPHGLGDVPGMVIFKRRDAAANWPVWHRSSANGGLLNMTNAFDQVPAVSAVSASDITIGSSQNQAGATYVAYLFAHNPGLIQCGSFTSNGATQEINMGGPCSWLLTKVTNVAGGWIIRDIPRGFTATSRKFLRADTSDAEADGTSEIYSSVNGFSIGANFPAGSYVYLAIRSPT